MATRRNLIENSRRLRHYNRENISLPPGPKLQLLSAPELIEEQRKGAVVLDTRPAERFASLYIHGSIQISLQGHFAAWAAILIHPAERLVLVAEDEKQAQEAQQRLSRVGLVRVAGYATANENAWRRAISGLGSISTLRCAAVAAGLKCELSWQLVDVRSRAEWLKGHLPGAISMPLLDIDVQVRGLEFSKPSLVYCHEGYRATTAASILLREGVGNVGILIDGIEGWSQSGLPLELPEDGRGGRISGECSR